MVRRPIVLDPRLTLCQPRSLGIVGSKRVQKETVVVRLARLVHTSAPCNIELFFQQKETDGLAMERLTAKEVCRSEAISIVAVDVRSMPERRIQHH